jgi:hypothetical protein
MGKIVGSILPGIDGLDRTVHHTLNSIRPNQLVFLQSRRISGLRGNELAESNGKHTVLLGWIVADSRLEGQGKSTVKANSLVTLMGSWGQTL